MNNKYIGMDADIARDLLEQDLKKNNDNRKVIVNYSGEYKSSWDDNEIVITVGKGRKVESVVDKTLR